jgi:hypothetical protein
MKELKKCLKDSASLLFLCLFFTWSHSERIHLGFSCAVFFGYFYCFLGCVFVCLRAEAESFKHKKIKYPTHLKILIL